MSDRTAGEEVVDTMDQRERASRSFFDRWSTGYEEMRISPWFQYTQDLTISHMELSPESRVLDVGCGTGYAVRRLGEMLPDGRAVGVDISPGMIAKAKETVPPGLAERIEFVEGSSASLPFPEDDFTHVLCTNSFHHYPDPLHALAEMRRVLEPGGYVLIFENAPDRSLYTWMWDKALRLFEKGHVRYYPSKELGAMIESGGFTAVELLVLQNEILKHGKLFASIQVWRGRKPSEPSQTPSGEGQSRADVEHGAFEG